MVSPRWWEQYIKLPWPDEVATLLKAAVSKEKETKGAVEEAELFLERYSCSWWIGKPREGST